MQKNIIQSPFLNSFTKFFFDISISILGLLLFSPLILTITFLLKITDGGPVLFRQKRVGKDKKIFVLFKFRTMRVGSEKLQKRLKRLNEATGPVFKILNDPRYTKIGKYLAHTGFDEFPQLINVLKGEMSLVGPRPLPPSEAKRLTKAQKIREVVKPGITSSWVVEGSHRLKFDQWMDLDKDYVMKANLSKDIEILMKTVFIMLKQAVKQSLDLLNFKNLS